MSIDTRIVSFIFDNKDFLKKIAETRSGLQKLDEDLKVGETLEGENPKVSSFFSNLNNKIQDTNLDKLDDSIQSTRNSFSKFDMVVTGIFFRLGQQIEETSVKMIKKLGVDQLTTGFNKYEQILKSTQTILAADPDTNQEKVNDQLKKLTWYTDETSYNMADMVSNISTFTNQGKNLEDATNEMIGIGNAAAMAGASVDQASHAMTGFAKAMGQGYMTAGTWNTWIKTSQIGTMEFKRQAIEAAKALGTIEQGADGLWYSIYDDSSEPVAVTAENFAASLTKGKWFNEEVMESVLKTYSKSIDDIYGKFLETGESTSTILEKYGKDFDEFSTKAFLLGQEATTFTQAIDSLFDALSSRWMQIITLIFGDYEEARKLWTGLANWLYDTFVTPMDYIYDIIETWSKIVIRTEKDSETGITKQITAHDGLIQSFKNILDVVTTFSEIVTNAIGKALNIDFDDDNAIKKFADILVSITTRFEKFTESLKPNEKKIKSLTNVFAKIFSILHNIWNIIRDLSNVIYKILYPIVSKVLNLLFGFTSSAGGSIINFLDTLTTKISKLINDFLNSKKFEAFTKSLDSIKKSKDSFSGILDFFTTLLDSGILDSVLNALLAILNAIFNIGDGFSEIKKRGSGLGFGKVGNKSSDPGTAIEKNKKKVSKESKSIWDIVSTTVINITKLILKEAEIVIQGVISIIARALPSIEAVLSSALSSIINLIADVIKIISDKDILKQAIDLILNNLSYLLTQILAKIVEFLPDLRNTLNNIIDTLFDVLDVVFKRLAVFLMLRINEFRIMFGTIVNAKEFSLGKLIKASIIRKFFGGFLDMFNNLSAGKFLVFAAVVSILAYSIKTLSDIPVAKANDAVKYITLIKKISKSLLELTGLGNIATFGGTIAVGKLANGAKGSGMGFASGLLNHFMPIFLLLAIAKAILYMAKAIKAIGSVENITSATKAIKDIFEVVKWAILEIIITFKLIDGVTKFLTKDTNNFTYNTSKSFTLFSKPGNSNPLFSMLKQLSIFIGVVLGLFILLLHSIKQISALDNGESIINTTTSIFDALMISVGLMLVEITAVILFILKASNGVKEKTLTAVSDILKWMMIGVIGIMVSMSLLLLSLNGNNLDISKIGTVCFIILAILGMIILFVKEIEHILIMSKHNDDKKFIKKLNALGDLMMSISGSMFIMMFGLKSVIKTISNNDVSVGQLAMLIPLIIIMLGAAVGILYIINKIAKNNTSDDTKELNKIAKSFTHLSASLLIIAIALAALTSVAGQEGFGKALIALGIILGAFLIMAAISAVIQSHTGVSIGDAMKGLAKGFLIFSAAIFILSIAINLFITGFLSFIQLFNDDNMGSITSSLNNLLEVMPLIAEAIAMVVAAIVGGLVTAIANSATIIATVVVTTLINILEMLAANLPHIVELLDQLRPLVIHAISVLIQIIFDTLRNFSGEFILLVIHIIELLRTTLPHVAALLDDLIDLVIFRLDHLLNRILQFIDKNTPTLIDTFLGIVDTIIREARKHISTWTNDLIGIVVDLINNIADGIHDISTALQNLLLTIVDEVINLFETSGEILGRLVEIPLAIFRGIRSGLGNGAHVIGDMIVEGLRDGLESRLRSLEQSSTGVGRTIIRTLMNVLDIHSPSGETKWQGLMLLKGYEKGFTDKQGQSSFFSKVSSFKDKIAEKMNFDDSLKDGLFNSLGAKIQGFLDVQDFELPINGVLNMDSITDQIKDMNIESLISSSGESIGFDSSNTGSTSDMYNVKNGKIYPYGGRVYIDGYTPLGNPIYKYDKTKKYGEGPTPYGAAYQVVDAINAGQPKYAAAAFSRSRQNANAEAANNQNVTTNVTNVTMNQTNNSPKAIDSATQYRQSKNLVDSSINTSASASSNKSTKNRIYPYSWISDEHKDRYSFKEYSAEYGGWR